MKKFTIAADLHKKDDFLPEPLFSFNEIRIHEVSFHQNSLVSQQNDKAERLNIHDPNSQNQVANENKSDKEKR